jgi:hypothetical protein
MSDEQNRPRDEKNDEKYRSLLKKIMENLGVDETEANFIRTLLKLHLEMTKPDSFGGRQNDTRKIEELDKIISDKKKLKQVMAEIDVEKIKARMAQKKEEGERRREEKQKQWGDKKKPMREKRDKMPSESPESPETSDEPAKTKKTSKTSKTSKKSTVGGYLNSSELLLSPDY